MLMMTMMSVDFHAALDAMSRTMVQDSRGNSVSEYQLITSLHRFRLAPAAHNGPAFLPWHREYINRFIIALSLSLSLPLIATGYCRHTCLSVGWLVGSFVNCDLS